MKYAYILMILALLISCSSNPQTLQEKLENVENPTTYSGRLSAGGTGLTTGWHIESYFWYENDELIDYNFTSSGTNQQDYSCSMRSECPHIYSQYFVNGKNSRKIMTMKEVAEHALENDYFDISQLLFNESSNCYYTYNNYTKRSFDNFCFEGNYLTVGDVIEYKEGGRYTFTIN